MTIRGPAWTAIEIPSRQDGATNYLGCMTDFNYSGKASKEETVKIAKTSTAAIEGCKASPETKLMLTSRIVNLKLCYKAARSTRSPAEYRDIDKVMNGMYRRITKNIASFPTALLYADRKLWGFGIKRLSTITPMAKLKVMLRSLKTTFPGCVAGAGIVSSPDTDDWETAPYCCIEITDGASLGCQHAYMMEVLAAAVPAPVSVWAPEM